MTDEAPEVEERVSSSSAADSGGSGAPVEEGAPTWVVTFGDMMSLLLTFFILMFSMSEMKQDRFLLAAQSLREAMGSTAEMPTETPLGLMPEEVDPELELSNPGMNNGATEILVDGEGGEDYIDVFAEAYMEMIVERLEQLIVDSGLDSGSIEVVTREEGVYLRIRDAALFPSGRAVMLQSGTELIASLSEITIGLGVPTIVSGHADSIPIRTAAFPSNWELSAARAAGVARQLVVHGQEPTDLEVQSFGEFQPVADNSTEEGRAQNRRVELFFSRDAIRDMALELQTAGPTEDPDVDPVSDATEDAPDPAPAGGQGGSNPAGPGG